MKEPLGRTVKFLNIEIRKFLDFHLNEYQLGNGQFAIVIEVSENKGINQDALAQKMGVDKTTIAKTVKKLVENGYIIKEEDENDRRSKKLYTTHKADLIFKKIKKLINLEKQVLTHGISQEEIKIFLKVVDCMKSNISEYLESGGSSDWKK
ncbi:MarR family winged helix-turn-helix transcriptional regulator [Ilyobacter polytropus]|uniref:Transcriptional regulator, MarR family n=1 Tax=Ilyobacter polytropus (strain ATCC 51220 / DSM 2926 / LMG 16218 / CuHBu1) TaxID=572544 RepID=E3HCB0_ILYPC|nr:MarR family transcriptional regulator [Ilyobacter polytropus]ADO84370.1 transcriptional regulator, MarR family [Ilyobacter polytropus DSM 2926]